MVIRREDSRHDAQAHCNQELLHEELSLGSHAVLERCARLTLHVDDIDRRRAAAPPRNPQRSGCPHTVADSPRPPTYRAAFTSSARLMLKAVPSSNSNHGRVLTDRAHGNRDRNRDGHLRGRVHIDLNRRQTDGTRRHPRQLRCRQDPRIRLGGKGKYCRRQCEAKHQSGKRNSNHAFLPVLRQFYRATSCRPGTADHASHRRSPGRPRRCWRRPPPHPCSSACRSRARRRCWRGPRRMRTAR